jgi:SnoaL-like domain
MAATPEEQNLALLDQADFDGWNGPDWAILREMHTDDVYVEWNGKVTDGYAAHEAVLRSVTEQYPGLKVTAHPIKVADGEWTATVGELTWSQRSGASRTPAAPGCCPTVPGSSRTARPCRCRCRIPGPGTAARRSPLPSPCLPGRQRTRALACESGTARGAGGVRQKLARVLEATVHGPMGIRLPASG